jgi:hypothetical protein
MLLAGYEKGPENSGPFFLSILDLRVSAPG